MYFYGSAGSSDYAQPQIEALESAKTDVLLIIAALAIIIVIGWLWKLIKGI